MHRGVVFKANLVRNKSQSPRWGQILRATSCKSISRSPNWAWHRHTIACLWTATGNSPFLVQVSFIWGLTVSPPPTLPLMTQADERESTGNEAGGRGRFVSDEKGTMHRVLNCSLPLMFLLWRRGHAFLFGDMVGYFPIMGTQLAIFPQSEADGNSPSEMCRQQFCPWREKARQLRCSQWFLLYRRHSQQFCPMREMANDFPTESKNSHG